MSESVRSEQAEERDSFVQKKYDSLKKDFEDIVKTIQNYEPGKRSLPIEPEDKKNRIDGYKSNLIKSYNAFVAYVGYHYSVFDEDSKLKTKQKVRDYRLKVLKSLTTLGLKTDLPLGFEKIEPEKIFDINATEDDNTEIFISASSHSGASSSSHETTLRQISPADLSPDESSPLSVSVTEDAISQFDSPIGEVENESFQSDPPNSVNSNQKSPNSVSTERTIVQRQLSNPIEIMPLGVEAILSGISDFSSQSQAHVTQFIANAQMMIDLAPDQGAIVLTVIRTRLATASALGDISNKTWNDIKASIMDRYIRADIPFETAQV